MHHSKSELIDWLLASYAHHCIYSQAPRTLPLLRAISTESSAAFEALLVEARCVAVHVKTSLYPELIQRLRNQSNLNPTDALYLSVELAVGLRRTGQAEKAMNALKEILINAEELGDKYIEGRVHVHIGAVNSDLNRTNEAIAAIDNALAVFSEIGEKQEVAISKINKALLSNQLGSKTAELADFQEATEVARQTGNKNYEAACLISLGWLQIENKDIQSALSNIQQALEIASQSNSTYLEALAHCYLGVAYIERKDLSKAEQEFRQADSLSSSAKNALIDIGVHDGFGRIHQIRREYEDAVKRYFLAMENGEKTGLLFSNHGVRTFKHLLESLVALTGSDAQVSESSIKEWIEQATKYGDHALRLELNSLPEEYIEDVKANIEQLRKVTTRK